MRPVYLCALVLAVVFGAARARAAQVPLRADFPDGAGADAVPAAGGIPFPQGALKSADNLRLLAADKHEIPCQATRLAVWPDGSVKWALVDAVITPADGQALTLEYGPDVRRANVAEPVAAVLNGPDARISGGGLAAVVRKNGAGVVDELSFGGKSVITADKPARLYIETLRIADGASGQALPVNHYLCRDPNAKLDAGKVQVDSFAVESPGPIRATILVRGHVLLPNFGATLPDEVKQRDPAGRVPFSTRVSFYKGSGVVYGQHQIVFSGEPDCDYIARWGIELPARAAERGCLVLEPGIELDQTGDKLTVAAQSSRLCWAPVQGGLALIRQGWQNRPCAITQENGAAWIDFWPRAAGVWDLRRYARDWAVGESGDTRNPKEIGKFAKYAARGLAKSHDFVLYFGTADVKGGAPPIAKSLAARTLLVAPPGWYASSQALGPLAPEQTTGEFAALDATTRQRLDYHLFSQDLFRWHGKLTYGFWQTRYGQIHRNDRWDLDYGRWAWSLNDGAGRIGHLLMLQFLRTLERRYFDGGEAFNRINYDTNMVHTAQHLENSRNWWTAAGCCHRHNVQPFGCPYVGMRGSYPVGQRILYLLTGDGVIADGLELVADTSFQYTDGHEGRLCNSGGSDGQGSAANALLWKYETTGDKKFLDACRKVLDKSGLIPPKDTKELGYGPSFGLFNAAGEYAELSGDKAFQDRVVALAKLGAAEKDPKEFVYTIAMGYRFSKDEALKTQLAAILKKISDGAKNSLCEQPPQTWPGHAGWKTPELEPNIMRDVPYAFGVCAAPDASSAWPKLKPNPRAIPAEAPADWYKPGGVQTAQEKVPPAQEILKLKAGAGGGQLTAGPAKWTAQKALADSVDVNGAAPLSGGIVPYIELAALKDGEARPAKVAMISGEVTSIGAAAGGLIASAKAGSASFTIALRPAAVDGVPSVRVEAACQVPKGSGRVASWGLLIPCKLSGNGNAIQTAAPGRFRLERCRLDQNDEQIPNWLTSEYHWGEGAALWPKWRESGIQIGPGPFYRIWRANRSDVSPVFCDQGEGTAAWFDLTDRGSTPRWGVTVRLLRAAPAQTDVSRQAVRANLETGLLAIQFHDAAAEPLTEEAGAAGVSGACDLIWHDGWRPPLSKPELTAAQYEKFIDDLNYGGNYGLFALRFALSITHQVNGRQWAEKVRDLGIEPREILYGMQFGDGLAKHCAKLGVKWDAGDVEGSVRRVIEHYRK